MSGLFPIELRTPEEIVQGIEQKMLARAEIKMAIEHYGDRRAMEAREEIIKQMGIPLKEEIEESLSRVSKMIDELFERTIFTASDTKKGKSRK